MSNVARMDARLRKEFARAFFMKHPFSTLAEANEEMRKRFKLGMSGDSLGAIRAKVQREKLADKDSETRPLRAPKGNVPAFVLERREEKEALIAEVQRRTDALAELLKDPKCPVFSVAVTKAPGGEVNSLIKRFSTATDTKKY